MLLFYLLTLAHPLKVLIQTDRMQKP